MSINATNNTVLALPARNLNQVLEKEFVLPPLGEAVVITGTPSAGQVPTATSTSAATWQTPSAGDFGWTSETLTNPNGTVLTKNETTVLSDTDPDKNVKLAAADAIGTVRMVNFFDTLNNNSLLSITADTGAVVNGGTTSFANAGIARCIKTSSTNWYVFALDYH